MGKREGLESEWNTLQSSADQYEHSSLNIKLMSLLVVGGSIALTLETLPQILLILLFWITEAVYKTFQFRIFARLDKIEAAIQNSDFGCKPFQFNSDFNDERGGISNLLLEYVTSALKPTIAVTYLVLIVVVFLT